MGIIFKKAETQNWPRIFHFQKIDNSCKVLRSIVWAKPSESTLTLKLWTQRSLCHNHTAAHTSLGLTGGDAPVQASSKSGHLHAVRGAFTPVRLRSLAEVETVDHRRHDPCCKGEGAENQGCQGQAGHGSAAEFCSLHSVAFLTLKLPGFMALTPPTSKGKGFCGLGFVLRKKWFSWNRIPPGQIREPY